MQNREKNDDADYDDADDDDNNNHNNPAIASHVLSRHTAFVQPCSISS
jgi:hypothetical protein